MGESITMKHIQEAIKQIEDNKPKCKKCGYSKDSHIGILGFNCECGCERDAKSKAGIKQIKIFKQAAGL